MGQRNRNHVIILPVDDLSNAAAEAVAKVVPGTLALPHGYGRLQFGEDLELTSIYLDWYWIEWKCRHCS
jgi:altronate dehydratase